jgi:hypothetical protein
MIVDHWLPADLAAPIMRSRSCPDKCEIFAKTLTPANAGTLRSPLPAMIDSATGGMHDRVRGHRGDRMVTAVTTLFD